MLVLLGQYGLQQVLGYIQCCQGPCAASATCHGCGTPTSGLLWVEVVPNGATGCDDLWKLLGRARCSALLPAWPWLSPDH